MRYYIWQEKATICNVWLCYIYTVSRNCIQLNDKCTVLTQISKRWQHSSNTLIPTTMSFQWACNIQDKLKPLELVLYLSKLVKNVKVQLHFYSLYAFLTWTGMNTHFCHLKYSDQTGLSIVRSKATYLINYTSRSWMNKWQTHCTYIYKNNEYLIL